MCSSTTVGAQGDLLPRSQGYREGWGGGVGLAAPRSPGSVWEEEEQDNKTLRSVPRESHPSPDPGEAAAETPLEFG